MADDQATLPQDEVRSGNGREFIARHGSWVLLSIIALAAAAIRWRTLGVPFERDEGEFAYAGSLILQGIPPFKLVYNMKMPGIYFAYAIVMALWGQTIWGVHLGLLIVNAGAVVCVFLLGRRLVDDTTGLAAAAAYAVLSMSRDVLGLFAHATQFLVLPMLAGFLLLFGALEKGSSRRAFWSGLLFGIAFMVKQHAAFFILFAGLYMLWRLTVRIRPGLWRGAAFCGLFSCGVFLPFAATCLGLWAAGVFPRFWFWTFDYARSYVSEVPLRMAPRVLETMLPAIVKNTWPIWFVGIAGLVAAGLWKRTRSASPFLYGFTAASALAVCPGFYFRRHYFVVLLPAVALGVGVALSGLSEIATRLWDRRVLGHACAAIAVVALAGHALYRQRLVLFELPLNQVSRVIYPGEPFPEAVAIGRYISAHSEPSDRVAVIGSEPEIYFYAHRHSATGFVYVYPLMEDQPYAEGMQKQLIREVERARPKFVVFVNVLYSWMVNPKAPRLLGQWLPRFLHGHYGIVMRKEIWLSRSVQYWKRSRGFITVFERKGSATWVPSGRP